MPTDKLLEGYDKIAISKAQAERFKNGGALSLSRLNLESEFQNEKIYRLYCENNFIGVGKANTLKEELKVLKCIHSENK